MARLLLLLCLLGCQGALPFPAELVDFVPLTAEPVFQPRGPGHWDAQMRERAWILREADGYHMWYDGFDEQQEGAQLALGYATSSDGITWRRYQEAPIYQESWVEDMMVTWRGGVYYMFAEGYGDHAHLLTSTDRRRWTDQGRLVVRSRGGELISEGPLGTPTAFWEAGRWYLLYERQDLGVWLASSTDLQSWTNVQDAPVITVGPWPADSSLIALNQVIKYQGIYYAYYNCQGHSPDWSTCVAASEDLLRWEKYERPLFALQGFDNSGFLVDVGDQFRLYTTHSAVRVFAPRHPPRSFTGDALLRQARSDGAPPWAP